MAFAIGGVREMFPSGLATFARSRGAPPTAVLDRKLVTARVARQTLFSALNIRHGHQKLIPYGKLNRAGHISYLPITKLRNRVLRLSLFLSTGLQGL